MKKIIFLLLLMMFSLANVGFAELKINWGTPSSNMRYLYSSGVLVGVELYIPFDVTGNSGHVEISSCLKTDSTIEDEMTKDFYVEDGHTYKLSNRIRIHDVLSTDNEYEVSFSSLSQSNSAGVIRIEGERIATDIYFIGLEDLSKPILWSSMDSGTSNTLKGVWGSSANDVFAVGDDGTIVHYNGDLWSSMDSGTDGVFEDVWGSSSIDVLVVGRDRKVLRYDGTSWSSIENDIGRNADNLYGIWGTSSDDIYIVGDYGTVLHYDGTLWSDHNVTGSFKSVWNESPTDVFVVGNSRSVKHYDGTLWSSMDSGALNDLDSIWGTSSNDVFAVGQGGTIIHYNGDSWTSMDSGTGAIFYDIWGVSSGYVFTVGYQGIITRYSLEALLADFTADCSKGTPPLTVNFTDQSIGHIASWEWDFGDGETSVQQNPVHEYSSTGIYSVSLTIAGNVNSDTRTKENYVAVGDADGNNDDAGGGGDDGGGDGGGGGGGGCFVDTLRYQ